jgi:hypothetical protein
LTKPWTVLTGFLLLFSIHLDLPAQVLVSLPKLTASPGKKITIPVTIGNVGKEEVSAVEFVISCDTNVVSLLGVEQKGTRTEGFMMLSNNSVAPYNKGCMKVVGASAFPISGNGILVNISARVAAKEGRTLIQLSNTTLNAGKPESKLIDGMITVRVPSDTKSKQGSGRRHR